MDTRLKYKAHIARAASKSLEAAMELKQLRGLSPSITWQLFASTVTPVVDYASNVWMHTFKDKAIRPINQVQQIGAQVIVGTFLTVTTSVAEAEAHITSVQSWFWRQAVKMWMDIHTLPETNPLHRNMDCIRKFQRFHHLPLYQVADVLKTIKMEILETINPFTLAPWEEQLQADIGQTPESQAETSRSIQITVSSSAQNKVVGFGRVIQKQPPKYKKLRLKIFSITLGTRSEQNPYSGELAAMAHTLKTLSVLKSYRITLLTSNKAATLTLGNPQQQSGQEHICLIYKLIRRLQKKMETGSQSAGSPQVRITNY